MLGPFLPAVSAPQAGLADAVGVLSADLLDLGAALAEDSPRSSPAPTPTKRRGRGSTTPRRSTPRRGAPRRTPRRRGTPGQASGAAGATGASLGGIAMVDLHLLLTSFGEALSEREFEVLTEGVKPDKRGFISAAQLQSLLKGPSLF